MNDMKIDDILRNCVEDLTKALNESREKIERLEAENARLRKQIETTKCPDVVWGGEAMAEGVIV